MMVSWMRVVSVEGVEKWLDFWIYCERRQEDLLMEDMWNVSEREEPKPTPKLCAEKQNK